MSSTRFRELNRVFVVDHPVQKSMMISLTRLRHLMLLLGMKDRSSMMYLAFVRRMTKL